MNITINANNLIMVNVPNQEDEQNTRRKPVKPPKPPINRPPTGPRNKNKN